MARVGGRNSWIAVPVGLGCAAIVGALVWLSLPMVPVTVAWAGDMLRNATTPRPQPTQVDTPARQAAEGNRLDCRTLYSDSLWNEMTWTGRTVLDQDLDPPSTTVPTLLEVLTPDVRVTCHWAAPDGGTVVSTLAAVDEAAPALAEAALRGQGFSCAMSDAGLHCAGRVGRETETHVFRDGLWLASVESAWHPEDYAARLERQVFG
ncbi:hypothetical protein MK786_14850 [Microbacterium sp. CFH 31415]|uniref:hypothetical protein n=1 Tax=Microbacterium sp. CFH 31415 TaxID=2921732 RepID=UPI001F138D41|nr:hypothetical protein [Microbacterium sp. CFH 31415]MCH6232027.1 hypothetical protein [Microbacterium sp. CFH 31415]